VITDVTMENGFGTIDEEALGGACRCFASNQSGSFLRKKQRDARNKADEGAQVIAFPDRLLPAQSSRSNYSD